MNKPLDKLEYYLLSERALDVQILLFIICISSGIINIIIFNNSPIGFLPMIVIFSIIILEILLTVFVILCSNTIKIKKGDE